MSRAKLGPGGDCNGSARALKGVEASVAQGETELHRPAAQAGDVLVAFPAHRLSQAVAPDRERFGGAIAWERPAVGERLDPQLAADARVNREGPPSSSPPWETRPRSS